MSGVAEEHAAEVRPEAQRHVKVFARSRDFLRLGRSGVVRFDRLGLGACVLRSVRLCGERVPISRDRKLICNSN